MIIIISKYVHCSHCTVSYLKGTCEANLNRSHFYIDFNNNDIKSSPADKDIFNANQSTEQLMDAPLHRKRLQDSNEEHGKFAINNAVMAEGNRKKRQHQTRRRHQPIDSMLNARVQLHETIIPEREAYRQSKQTKLQHHTIPEENVIIGICSKVFRKCFPSSSSLPCTVQKMVSVWFIN